MSLPPSYSYSEVNHLIHPVDSLPSYSTGAEVRPVPDNSQQAIMPPPLQIVLSSECHARDSFDIGDIVHGHLVLTPRTPLHLAQLAIAFGYDEAVKQHRWVSDTVTCKYGQLGEFVVPRSSFFGGSADENGVMILEPGFEYSFPFAVQVPELQAIGNCKHHGTGGETALLQHLRLPPSLGSPPERNVPADNIENNDARVSYKLVAMARRPDRSAPAFQATEYIHLLPSYAIVPAAAEHLYTKNFQLRPRGVLRRTAFRGAVKMRIDGAAAVVIRGAPTVAKLTLVATPAAPGLPPPTVADIFVKLTAYTSYLSETPKCNTFGVAMPASDLSPWVACSPSSLSGAGGDGKTDMQLLVPLKLKLPQTKLITPTFASCIVERWYTMTVSVVLSDHSILALEMPVVIVANAQARSAAPYAVGAPTPIYLHSEIENHSASYESDDMGPEWASDPIRDISRQSHFNAQNQQTRQQQSHEPEPQNLYYNDYSNSSRVGSTSNSNATGGSLDSSGLRCNINHSGGRHSATGSIGGSLSAAAAAAGASAVHISDPPSYICI